MPKKDAQAFIANLMSEEEAVGEVTTMASSRTREARKRKSVSREEENDETDEDGDATAGGASVEG